MHRAWCGRMDDLETTDPRHINSVDATTGQPIVARVMARRSELELLRAGLTEHDVSAQGDIDLALAAIDVLLTGDLEHVPPVVAAEMNRWLERNKHLAESVAAPANTFDA